MELAPRLFVPSALRLIGIRLTSAGLTLIAEPATDGTDGSICPACGVPSRRIHSHYSRLLQDLPALGRGVQIELRLRRFFCDLPDCPAQTFAERLPDLTVPRARKTSRLVDALREIAFSAGGQEGSRLAGGLGMPASGDTLRRLVRRVLAPAPPHSPRVLGVDDWAMRRGQVYGTILCDLETRRPVDLLPDRSAQVLADWLKAHPGAQVISRDRGGEYAKGASLGAPEAIQVADRWHLLHNLTDALQRGIEHQSSLLNEAAREVTQALAPPATVQDPPDPPENPENPLNPDTCGPATHPLPVPAPLSAREQKPQDSRAARLARYQQVQELLAAGKGLRQIGRELHIARDTVKRFARCQEFPERATRTPLPRAIDPYVTFLQEQFQQGRDNVKQLWVQIQAQGFTGSVYMVKRQIRQWRRATGRPSAHGPKPRQRSPRIIRPSARRVAWLALGHVRKPTAQDQAVMAFLARRWPSLAETAELCRQFATVFKDRDVPALGAWMQLAQEPSILPEVRRFAESLRQDWEAVVEAVRQPWSQGQTEGQINRLKLIKRQMYGRASFDLLRQRVLNRSHAPSRPACAPVHAKAA